MNNVQLTGIIATEIKVSEFPGPNPGEKRVKAAFLLAVRRPRKNAPADWVRVETWGLQAVNLAQYNGKGSRVGVSGRVRSEFYNPDGGERGGQIRSTVVADSIEYIGRL